MKILCRKLSLNVQRFQQFQQHILYRAPWSTVILQKKRRLCSDWSNKSVPTIAFDLLFLFFQRDTIYVFQSGNYLCRLSRNFSLALLRETPILREEGIRRETPGIMGIEILAWSCSCLLKVQLVSWSLQDVWASDYAAPWTPPCRGFQAHGLGGDPAAGPEYAGGIRYPICPGMPPNPRWGCAGWSQGEKGLVCTHCYCY